MIKYKLVTNDYLTRPGRIGEKIWLPGRLVTTRYLNSPAVACSSGVLHYYHSPYQAEFFKYIHDIKDNTRLLRILIDNELGTDGTKGWCKGAVVLNEMASITLTISQRVYVAILCSLEIYFDSDYINWANGWLNNSDRSAESARSAARSAAWSAAESAWSAWSAARSAAAYNLNFDTFIKRAIENEN